MKILSWNINCDYSNISTKVDIIISLIEVYNLDVIGLQEVIPEVYNLLFEKLHEKYTISNKQNKSFFNMIISRFCYPIEEINFTSTNMRRGFLVHKTDNLTFITTHLESIPININIRQSQVADIIKKIKINDGDDVIVFGDTNFIESKEIFGELHYIKPDTSDVYTYDSQLNNNATKPFRSNLDRFYTNISKLNVKKIDILLLYTISDHFPILLTI